MRSRFTLFLFLFYLSILVVSAISAFFTGTIVFPKSGIMVISSLSGGLAMVIFITIYAIHDWEIDYRGVTTLMIFYGMDIGLLSYFFKLSRFATKAILRLRSG